MHPPPECRPETAFKLIFYIDENTDSSYNAYSQERGGGSMSRVVFFYAYVPNMPANPDDGGFSVNLYDNNYLEFSTYHANRTEKQKHMFVLQPAVCLSYISCVQGAESWLADVPPVMRGGQGFSYTAYMGIAGFREFLIEDFSLLMNKPFRSMRAHYARKIYTLLEDISSILYGAGFILEPDTFWWDPARVQPFRTQVPGYTTMA